MVARSLVKTTVPLAFEIPLGTSAMLNAASSNFMRPLTCGSLKEPRTVASVVTPPEETKALLKSCRKPRSSLPSTRRSSGFFCSVNTRPERLRSVPRPTRWALSTVTVEPAKRSTMGPEFFNVSASAAISTSGAGPNWNCGMRSSAFIARQFSAGPSMRSVPSMQPANRAAAVLAIQAPLAIALHYRAGHGGLQMRAQREALRTGGEVRVAQRLAFDLHAFGGDIGVQFVDAIPGLGGGFEFHLPAGRHLERAFQSGMDRRDGADLFLSH